MKKDRKTFLEMELIRYEDAMNAEIPGSDEYEELRRSYMEIYKELYPKKNLWDKIVDIGKIIIPAGCSIFLGIYAYHKNENLESKDGDVWKEARRR